MRRKVGIVVGACTALALAGTAGVSAYAYATDGTGRTVGWWQAAPGGPRTPVALSRTAPADPIVGATPAASSGPTAGASAEVARKAAATTAAGPSRPAESGRQRVGALEKVGKLLGYAGAPQRETFRYPGASYVKLHFDRMLLLPGDYLTVSDKSGAESYRYDASTVGGLPAAPGGRWAMSVSGDTAVLELHRTATGALGLGTPLSRLGVTVDRAARGFSVPEQRRNDASQPQLTAPREAGRSGREESVCGGDQSADAVCYQSSDPVAYTRSKAIARLLINGTELCTGWRVGPNNRMLTNNHCFTTSADAYQTEVWFNYQCTKCGGYQTLRPTKVWGDRVLATNHVYDYTVFTVEQFPLVQKFGYLALDTRRPNRNEELYIPQHPAGEPARIAGARGDRAGTCSVVDRDYDGYATDSDVAYYCDTQGGSSGSPVLSRVTNKVVALHHFGGCPNSGVRADLLLTKIAKLL